MTDWLIISAAKIMKLAILTTVSLVTPPDDPAPPHSVIPGVAPCCRGTMMLMSREVTVDETVVTNFEVREISL
jgi:hypothetical protein